MDDAFQAAKNATGGSGAAQAISCLCGLACLGGLITYTVYLGIYAYNNPDPEECWWIKGLDVSQTTSAAATAAGALSDPALTAEPVNVHLVYVGWFLWGFWMCISPCIAAPVLMTLGCVSMQATQVLGGLFSCALGCGQLFWVIFGFVWRWGAMGQASSRDALPTQNEGELDDAYQTRADTFAATHGLQQKGGAFMNVLNWIVLVSVAIQVGFCLSGIIVSKIT